MAAHAYLPASPPLTALQGSEIFLCVPLVQRNNQFDRREAYETYSRSVTAQTIAAFAGVSFPTMQPLAAAAGQAWFDASTNRLNVWNGVTWVGIALSP